MSKCVILDFGLFWKDDDQTSQECVFEALFKGYTLKGVPLSLCASHVKECAWHCQSATTCESHSNTSVELTSLPLPNEDFGRMNKRCNPDVRSTFQGREYSIWATNH